MTIPPLVNAKCTNCGANIEVDNTKEAMICKFCGSAFIVEKAINNYNVTNNITAQTVHIYGGNSVDFVITAGKLIKYNGASTDVIIPDTVKEIGECAFEDCSSLANISIPDSVTKIGSEAFRGCIRLTNVIIPDSVIEIGYHAFDKNIKNVQISPDLLDKFAHEFRGSYFYHDLEMRKKMGVCYYCGGTFKLFSKTCKKCGKKNHMNKQSVYKTNPLANA